ncbi:hypothetical protein ACFE04_003707 [Oxalis oulophora]
MGTTLLDIEEDYIDMEIISSSTSSLLCYTSMSPPILSPLSQSSREFEFQMTSSSISNDEIGKSTTYYNYAPADELFYKGKLLPLDHRKLLISDNRKQPFDDQQNIIIPNNPLLLSESCSISFSPSESGRISSDKFNLLDDYFFEWTIDQAAGSSGGCISNDSKTKKITLKQKLKASLKAFFNNKSSQCTKAAEQQNVSKLKHCFNKYMKLAKKNYKSSPIIIDNDKSKKILEEEEDDDTVCVEIINHRRSFSGAIQKHCYLNKKVPSLSLSSSSISSSGSSSSSSSSSVFGFSNSEIENSIEGAIAHCKQSQVMFSSGKVAVNEVLGNCSISASRISRNHQERPGLCTI